MTSNLQGLSRCRPGRMSPTARFRLNSVRQPARRPLPDFRYLELHVKTPESCQDFEECKNLANLCSGSEEFRDSHLSSNSWVCKGVDCKIRLSHVLTLQLNWFQVSIKVTNIKLRIYYSAKEIVVKRLWQYGLWSFQTRDTKVEIFLPKNQHTQNKINEFWDLD